MADTALGFVLENLKQLVCENASLILGVKDEARDLEDNLDVLKSFIEDLKQSGLKSSVLKTDLKQIREFVYKAEDVLETYVSHVSQYNSRGKVDKATHVPDYALKLRDVATEIKSLSEKVKMMYDKKSIAEMQIVLRPQTNTMDNQVTHVEKDKVQDLPNDSQQIINLLNGESRELEVISIIGMPGMGKTTLARMIYDELISEKTFEKGVRVYVSQKYDIKSLYIDILGQLIDPNDKIMHETMHLKSLETLAQNISGILKELKYLILIDDVWEEDDLKKLKNALPNNKKKSRIMVTSRTSNVNVDVKSEKNSHHLQPLNEDESWRLLKAKVIGSENCDPDLEKRGRSIARKCEGLPLAIDVIGGVMLRKGQNQWGAVDDRVDAFLSTKEDKRLKKSIEKSFSHLDPAFKPCFLYFGMFPKNYKIQVSKLFRLWIAEGLIRQKEGMTLEEMAEEHLYYLVRRNLVMATARRSNGKIKICQLHGILHGFCKKKAAKEFAFKEFNEGTDPNLSFADCRRLGTQVFDGFSLKRFLDSNIRCFLCFPGHKKITQPPDLFIGIPKDFKLLRVIDGLVAEFPLDLAHLFHLKYLDVLSKFSILPAEISNLCNMQTLILETTSNTLEIKADIWKMIQLRHFKTNASASLVGPQAIIEGKSNDSWVQQVQDSWERLLNGLRVKPKKDKSDHPLPRIVNIYLQTLSTISPESCTEDVFAAAPKLKKLGIRGPLAKLVEVREDKSCLFDNLGKLNQLENLKLVNDVELQEQSARELVSGLTVPEFSEKLKKLTLSNTKLAWTLMSELGKLSNLEILKLKDNAFSGKEWKSEEGGFGVLKELHIGTTDLVTWEASANPFPKLQHLYLTGSSELKVPSAMKLRVFDKRDTCRSAGDTAKQNSGAA